MNYPHVIRNQWHGSHDYTLQLSSDLAMRLSPEQYEYLKASIAAVDELERPLSEDEVSAIIASLRT